MQNRTPRTKPAYSIEAVDNALQLMQLLRDVGAVRLKDAAAELGVAPSTAHRLLAMLIYRGFAIQDEAKRYLPGPSMGVGPAGMGWTRQLRRLAQPHMEALAADVDEAVNLVIRVGTKVRFLSTVEGSNILRVGDRQGTVMPARHASGGKALLAQLNESALEHLYRSPAAVRAGEAMSEAEYTAFLQEMAAVRAKGFAANFEGTEDGISALGIAVRGGDGRVAGAISVAVPAVRFRKVFEQGLLARSMDAVRRLEQDLAAIDFDEENLR